MEILDIFALQFVLSLTVIGLIAALRLAPWLQRQELGDALFWLAVPHAFRHLGLVFLVPGVVSASLPENFAGAAAYGDLAAGILAIALLVAAHFKWSAMVPLAWATSVVGLVDLVNALSHIEVVPHLQSAWYIPTIIVPVLLVTHVMTLTRLIAYHRAKIGTIREA
ncbi:MAG TPA: hypothetical protein DCS82_12810 [Rhodospirillaceae bacterium]|nr:hypothetical protein [Rhodospirillaceae bacterium]HAA90857.1 hypothetical protein [Rhodospirillaceae bacterium]HAT36587.1 hypothetical protein [Rhodospirillaceae bacterium]